MRCKCIKDYPVLIGFTCGNIYYYHVNMTSSLDKKQFIEAWSQKTNLNGDGVYVVSKDNSQLFLHDNAFNEHFIDIVDYRDKKIQEVLGE